MSGMGVEAVPMSLLYIWALYLHHMLEKISAERRVVLFEPLQSTMMPKWLLF